QSEVAVRTTLISDVLVGLLGYKAIDPESVYSLAVERQIGRGSVDVALGRFDYAAGRNEVVAPFELKARSSRLGTMPSTRRARTGFWCRIASKSGSTALDAGGTLMRCST